jgi:hypothetical protein
MSGLHSWWQEHLDQAAQIGCHKVLKTVAGRKKGSSTSTSARWQGLYLRLQNGHTSDIYPKRNITTSTVKLENPETRKMALKDCGFPEARTAPCTQEVHCHMTAQVPPLEWVEWVGENTHIGNGVPSLAGTGPYGRHAALMLIQERHW